MTRTTLRGHCLLCERRATKAGMTRHLKSCVSDHAPASEGEATELVQLRVEAAYDPLYWLDLEIEADGTLEDLDLFLRAEWVECCGHLSAFEISGRYYGDGHGARSAKVRLDRVLPDTGVRFAYEYDFGSSTHLALRVVRRRTGPADDETIRILARNEPPVWPCAVCGQPATWVCSFCGYEDDNPFSCNVHAPGHACGDEGLLPVADSPRMGVCCYEG